MQAIQSSFSSSNLCTGSVSSCFSTQTASYTFFQFANLNAQEVITWKKENARLIEFEFQNSQAEIVNNGNLKKEMEEKLALDEQAIQDPTKVIEQHLESLTRKIAQAIERKFGYSQKSCDRMSKDIMKERFEKFNILYQIHGKNENDRTINLGERSKEIVESLCQKGKYDFAKLVAERMIDPRWKVRFLAFITDVMLRKKDKETTSKAYVFLRETNFFDYSDLKDEEVADRLQVIIYLNTVQIESDSQGSEERANFLAQKHSEKIEQVSKKGNSGLVRFVSERIPDGSCKERSLAPVTLNLGNTASTEISGEIYSESKPKEVLRENDRTPQLPITLSSRERVRPLLPNASLSDPVIRETHELSDSAKPVASRCNRYWNNSILFRFFCIVTCGFLPLFVWFWDCLCSRHQS